MSVSAQVLVFDSGVGALSIIDEIRHSLPQVTITYASDNGFFPYGNKSEADLIQRVDRVLHALVAQSAPDIIVVACNTASTVALPKVREHFSIPIVGVVPAIKPAAQLSTSRVIGLLGTPGTVSRPYTRQLISDFAGDCTIIPLGSTALVEMAEQKLRGRNLDPDAIKTVLLPLTRAEDFAQMDTIVLACTHFPLIRNELSEALNKPLHWVDSGAAIARRVAHLLGEGELANSGLAREHAGSRPRGHRSLFTLDGPEIEQLRPHLARLLPGPVGFLDVNGEW